jgi:stearoyl-CoA desaturase (delta-9 desaturase)
MSTLAKNLLRRRRYADIIVADRKPTLGDVLPEWLDTVNVFKNREAFTTWIWLAQHLLGLVAGVFFFSYYLSWTGVLWWLGFALINAHFFHTFWYHRFCSHRAFKFRRQWFAKLIYWLNPLMIKEETYVIPHFVHHKISDTPGDPYGPRNGYWGSFSATESANFFNREMLPKEATFCLRFLSSIPSTWNTEESFRATGSFEKTWCYPLRFVVCNAFWVTLFLLLGRPDLLAAFYFGAVTFLFIMRDFNFRGHDEESEHEPKLDNKSLAVNQWFYGILASEWHDNHHRFSTSAKSGFAKRELDISFAITRLLHKVGVLESYVDSSRGYEREIIRVKSRRQSQAFSTSLRRSE